MTVKVADACGGRTEAMRSSSLFKFFTVFRRDLDLHPFSRGNLPRIGNFAGVSSSSRFFHTKKYGRHNPCSRQNALTLCPLRTCCREHSAQLLAAQIERTRPEAAERILPSGVPSQVRDAYGPHDGNEHTRRAIASDDVHSAEQSDPAGLVYSFPPNAPRCHSATEIAWE
jgi:hypothetical protein